MTTGCSNAGDEWRAKAAAKRLADAYGESSPGPLGKIVDDLDELMRFYDFFADTRRALGAPGNSNPDRVDLRDRRHRARGHRGVRHLLSFGARTLLLIRSG